MHMNHVQENTSCCPPKPALHNRPLLTPNQAAELASIFKVLANDTRLCLLYALVRAGELCVSDLAQAVGMKPLAALGHNHSAAFSSPQWDY